MILGGELKAKGPELRKSETHFEKEGVEFDLITEEKKNPEIENFDIWIRLNEDDVTIQTDYIDGEPIQDSLGFSIKDKKGNNIDITISVSQARVLRDILEHFTNAFYSMMVLRQVKRVDRV